jgi:hypothetical protein
MRTMGRVKKGNTNVLSGVVGLMSGEVDESHEKVRVGQEIDTGSDREREERKATDVC